MFDCGGDGYPPLKLKSPPPRAEYENLKGFLRGEGLAGTRDGGPPLPPPSFLKSGGYDKNNNIYRLLEYMDYDHQRKFSETH